MKKCRPLKEKVDKPDLRSHNGQKPVHELKAEDKERTENVNCMTSNLEAVAAL
jgi:hypothetical protein